MVAWSGAGSSWVLCLTMDAANWLMSWDSLRVRLGIPQVSAHSERQRQACGNRKDPTTKHCDRRFGAPGHGVVAEVHTEVSPTEPAEGGRRRNGRVPRPGREAVLAVGPRCDNRAVAWSNRADSVHGFCIGGLFGGACAARGV